MATLKEFISSIKGDCYLVGGAVIDSINNNPIKDWDIEVYGVDYQTIVDTLKELGVDSDLVGKSFGVLKTTLSIDGIPQDIDISLPRTETKVGEGHKGFKVEVSTVLDTKQASRRRDLTINSIMKNLKTGEIVDNWGGQGDLLNGILRHVDCNTFKEDPLRVLRVMQLLPRKGRTVSRDTIQLCRSMFDMFKELPKERVYEEFNKLLLKSSHPSQGLRFLRDCDWIEHFPVLLDLIGCQQHPTHHPEGDVWTHTLLVLDHAANVRDELDEEWRLPFMWGMLLHDIGKPSTTEFTEKGYTAYNHDVVGAEMATVFMSTMTTDKKVIERVRTIVMEHMNARPLLSAGKSSWRRLHNRIRLDIIGAVSMSDTKGRTTGRDTGGDSIYEICKDYYKEFGVKKIPKIITGRVLIDEYGFKEGKYLGMFINRLYELQLDGYSEEEIRNIIEIWIVEEGDYGLKVN